jgi:periplasmic protein TonB
MSQDHEPKESESRGSMPSEFYGDDDAAADASGTFLRFLIPSVLVVVLLVGGVYWMKHLPSSLPPSDSGGNVQVRLLQTPDPAPIPLQATDRPASPNVGTRADVRRDQPEPRAEDVSPSPPSTVTASIDPAPSVNVSPLPSSVSNPPNDVALRFQQALMRHIERFQRYPGTARRDRLEGTVQVGFVMGRDGKILEAWIRSSSGQTLLDKEAVDALRRAEPLPIIPGELPDRLSVLVPVAFAAP